MFILVLFATQLKYGKPPEERRKKQKISFTIYPRGYHEERMERIIRNFKLEHIKKE